MRCLNRVIRWLPDGIALEADPRHAELLAAMLGPAARPLSAPGAREPGQARDRVHETGAEPASAGVRAGHPGEEALSPQRAGLYRAGAARANYLALDRPDISFAAKELCRRMSAPREADLTSLRRMARYLIGAPRQVYYFALQGAADIDVYADTDWAGCPVTRRSTSGGCAVRGSHLIKHWATTQKVVTLSSGEAELGGVVKGSSEGLGLQSVGLDLGLGMRLRVHTDPSVAQGICSRSGIGKVRHLAVSQLWVQERIREGAIQLFKCRGEFNPADLMAKHLDGAKIVQCLKALSVRPEDGRAQSAPRLAAEVEAFLAPSGVRAPAPPGVKPAPAGGGPWHGDRLSLVRMPLGEEAVGHGDGPANEGGPNPRGGCLSLNPCASSDSMCSAPLRLRHAVLPMPLWAQEGCAEGPL